MGKGTGLGLAISYQIVTEKHGGKLLLRSRTASEAGYSLTDILQPDSISNIQTGVQTDVQADVQAKSSPMPTDFGIGTEFEILLPLL